LLLDLYASAVAAAAPGPALARALEAHRPPAGRRIFILSLGKAATPMAAQAVRTLEAWNHPVEGGLIVTSSPSPSPHPRLELIVGDHPHPGAASRAAAARVEALARSVGRDDEIWVLLSGGTTSLIAAPIDGIGADDLQQLYHQLLGSGLDIAAMNRIRKRFSLWGGGRLAAALTPARVKNFTISDVIDDDLAAIGSGPCVPDESNASDVRRALAGANLWDLIPASVRAALEAVMQGDAPETPKPGDPAFGNLTVEVIVSNRLALEAVSRRATELGLLPRILDGALAGEAAPTGRRLAQRLLSYAEDPVPKRGGMHKDTFCLIWGGETTVTLGPAAGVGGRNQELALAAAQLLAGQIPVALMSVGTDGRDGPSEAAGAIVDEKTWDAIRQAGRDPAQDLAGHNAFPALSGAGAIIPARPTGTNVMDVVIGLRQG